jgi:hypothetical protein
VPTRLLFSRLLAAGAAALLVAFVLACSAKINQGPPPKQPQPQPQPNPPPKVDPFANAPTSIRAYELFDQGKEGEDKYKGKVVSVNGRVNLAGTKPAGGGGTTTVTIEGDHGDPPYAIATVGADSNDLLAVRNYGDVALASLVGIYKGRDGRGTVLLEPAKVRSVAPWFDAFRAQKDRNPKDKNQKPTENKDQGAQPPTKDGKDKNGKPIEKKEGKTPVVVTAEKLAQDLTDDVVKNYPRYYGKPLQITGTVSKRTDTKTEVTQVQFQPKVKDKEGKETDLTVFCSLKPPVSFKGKAAENLAVGKKVTIRGNLAAAGNGQATLLDCVVVPD